MPVKETDHLKVFFDFQKICQTQMASFAVNISMLTIYFIMCTDPLHLMSILNYDMLIRISINFSVCKPCI